MQQNLLHRLLLTLIAALLLTALAIMFVARNGGAVPINSQPRQMTTTVRAEVPPRPPLDGPATQPAPAGNDKTIPTEVLFGQIEQTLAATGTQAEGVLTIDLPRNDLTVFLDGNEVPVAAGVGHQFLFHRCPCGSMLAHGQFVLLNHEINDVIDALRQDPEMKVAGSSPFLLGSEPALTLLRFQAEGDAQHVARVLKGALRWVGEARTGQSP
jgi:hypothetical protein